MNASPLRAGETSPATTAAPAPRTTGSKNATPAASTKRHPTSNPAPSPVRGGSSCSWRCSEHLAEAPWSDFGQQLFILQLDPHTKRAKLKEAAILAQPIRPCKDPARTDRLHLIQRGISPMLVRKGPRPGARVGHLGSQFDTAQGVVTVAEDPSLGCYSEALTALISRTSR